MVLYQPKKIRPKVLEKGQSYRLKCNCEKNQPKTKAGDQDVNQKQAKDWLHILETLGIIFYLHPYSNNLLKRLVKTPKLYFYDTGLVCYLTKWSSAEVM